MSLYKDKYRVESARLQNWQSRYHDRIVRDDTEYERIKKYIIHNPANWVDDTFH